MADKIPIPEEQGKLMNRLFMCTEFCKNTPNRKELGQIRDQTRKSNVLKILPFFSKYIKLPIYFLKNVLKEFSHN